MESAFVEAHCDGQIEYVLEDKTRVDCLTEDFAVEFDFASKWLKIEYV